MYLAFDEHRLPGNQLVPIVRFQGEGNLSFDQIIHALRTGGGPIEVILATQSRVVRGVALEVDESGILRIGHQDAMNKPGVRVLVKRQDNALYGEFVD
jgi:hypothetical protein